MLKIALVPLLVAASCLIAASVGIVQDLITYEISRDWYHNWKFYQFNVDPAYHGRIGAMIVGVGATWWMGLLLAVPVLCVTVLAATSRAMAVIFIKAALIVAVSIIAIEIAAYLYGLATISPEALPSWATDGRFSDPVGAFRVQNVNAAGYMLGAPTGLALGMIYAVIHTRRSHR